MTKSDRLDKQTPAAGDVLADGWIFLGTSPSTGKAYSLEPADSAPQGTGTWFEAEAHATALRDQGHANARLPQEPGPDECSELRDIFAKIVKGGHNDKAGLDTRPVNPDGRYWLTTIWPDGRTDARLRYMDEEGSRAIPEKSRPARIRCVRDEPKFSI